MDVGGNGLGEGGWRGGRSWEGEEGGVGVVIFMQTAPAVETVEDSGSGHSFVVTYSSIRLRIVVYCLGYKGSSYWWYWKCEKYGSCLL